MTKQTRTTARPKFDRRIVAIRGDMHAGLDDGLKNPDTLIPVVDEEGGRAPDKFKPVTLRPMQHKLWKWHEEARAGISALAGADPITLIEMGDATEGNWHRENLGDAKLSDQFFIAHASFLPWLDMKQVNEAFIVRGTGTHTWFAGSSETILTHALKAKYPGKRIENAHHWLMNVAGVWMDVAHKGPFYGKRNWLQGNEFHWYIQSVLMEDVTDGNADKAPAIMLRAHFHTYTQAWGWYQTKQGYWECKGIITPAMSFINEYAKGATASKGKVSVGMIALEIINGKLHDVHPFVHWLDMRTLVTV